MARKPNLPGAEDFFQVDDREVKRASRKTVKRANRKPVQKPMSSELPVEGGLARTIEPGFTEKVTFYLAPEILKRLELTRVQLLLEHNLKVSRSQIVEVMLEQMVGEAEQIAGLLESAVEY